MLDCVFAISLFFSWSPKKDMRLQEGDCVLPPNATKNYLHVNQSNIYAPKAICSSEAKNETTAPTRDTYCLFFLLFVKSILWD